MLRLYRYFISYPFHMLLWYFARTSSKKTFTYFFNLKTFLNNCTERIYFNDNSFYFKDRDWRFSSQAMGYMFYNRGFKKRIIDLKDAYLITNLEFNDNDVIIDIGANNGDFYLCFEKKIEYFGFEPSPKTFQDLKYNVKNQNLINKGVWNDLNKEIEFFLRDESGDSSIIPIKDFTSRVVIETTTLDKIIDEINKPIKLIKIEAEGAEPEILDGFKKNLNNVKYISIDCGFERGIERSSTITECSNYLINNNFEMMDFKNSRVVLLFKNKNIS
jgi:FkbM family methyltransferase